jgi:glutathione S-transferase
MILHYKSIPYNTQWIEYPDIAPFFEPLVPPNALPTSTPYTVPAIRLPDGEYVMNSTLIAPRLDLDYTDKEIHSDHPSYKPVIKLLSDLLDALDPIYIPAVARDLLNPASAEYFYRTRQEMVGMPLDEFEKSEVGGENAWKAAEPYIKELAALYREDKTGPFLVGKDPIYSDFVILGWLKLFDRIGHLESFKQWGGEELIDMYEAAEPWHQRDDH